MNRPEVLLLADWYVPGFKAGGPITSAFKMVEACKSDVDFRILTRGHDWHDPTPYDVEKDRWLERDQTEVFYFRQASFSKVWTVITSSDADVIYFNGLYAPTFHALPLLRMLVGTSSKKLIVAPRGMLNPNAIALKSIKKRLLLFFYKVLGIERKVVFHSTGSNESKAIKATFPRARIAEVSNLPAIEMTESRHPERSGFVSVGRLSPVKNTLELLRLTAWSAHSLTLIGTHDDEAYFKQCQEVIHEHSNMTLIDGLAPDRLTECYRKARYFISMTTGENFGHAIIEALAAGCPVIISDQTPWNDVESFGAGWVIPLNDIDRWNETLKAAAEMDPDRYALMSERAIEYVKCKFDIDAIRNQYLALFGATN